MIFGSTGLMVFSRFGLVFPRHQEVIPLKDVKISCSVTSLSANVKATFTYTNTLDYATEAKFVFPLDNVAVYSFEAKIDERVIVAECRPRKEAKMTYQEAVSLGHTAFIMEQDERCEDVFQMSIGHVPVGGTVFITMKYVGQLTVDQLSDAETIASRALMTLPSVLNPRYSPNESEIPRRFDPFDGCLWNKSPYTIAFEAFLFMPEPIVSVSSKRDTFIVTKDHEDARRATVVLEAGFTPDHDLQMVIELANPLKSFAVIETSGNIQCTPNLRHCVMVQFMPDFRGFADEQELRTELVFVVDRSGSMGGSRIHHASESLLLFLKSLSPGCRFQIISFGSTHETVFREIVDYNEENLATALRYQENMDANMGGTEVLPALRTAYDSPLSGVGWYRQIIFLTDGDVGNANEVIGLVESNIHKARLFSVGIGEGVSTNLISSVARAGHGFATFIRDDSQLRSAVMKVLKSALQPRALPKSLQWNLKLKHADGSTSIPDIVTAPTVPPAIFSNCFSTMFAFFDGEPKEVDGKVELFFDIMGDQNIAHVPISVSTGTVLLHGDIDAPIHRLAAKCLLNQLGDQLKAAQMVGNNETRESLQNQMEQISCLFNVMCPYTSFVGVDPVKREEAVVSQPPAEEPVQYFGGSHSSHGLRRKLCAAVSPKRASSCASQPMSDFSRMAALNDSAGPMKQKVSCVVELVKLQQFSGSWTLSDDVVTLLEIGSDIVRQEKPQTWPSSQSNKTVSDEIWITALVLAYLELKQSAAEVEWELVARKARQWLQTQAKLVDPSVAGAKQLCVQIIQQAREVIRAKVRS